MEKREQFILKKIPLEVFIKLLINVYNDGANFIDIIGTPDREQDYIKIKVKESYFEKQQYNELSEEDLNQLI